MSKTSISGCSTFFAAGDAIPPQLKANVSKVSKSLFAAKTTTLLGMIGLNLFHRTHIAVPLSFMGFPEIQQLLCFR